MFTRAPLPVGQDEWEVYYPPHLEGVPLPGHLLPDSGIPGYPRMTSAVLELIKGRTAQPWNLPVFSSSLNSADLIGPSLPLQSPLH